MAGRKPKCTPEQVAQALIECRGLLFLTAKRLGVSHQTVSNMMKRHPSVAAAAVQQRGEFVDEAEGMLWKAVRNGESWAISFTLKCLGKVRGYTERTEITGADGGPVRFDIDAVISGELARLAGTGKAETSGTPAADADAEGDTAEPV